MGNNRFRYSFDGNEFYMMVDGRLVKQNVIRTVYAFDNGNKDTFVVSEGADGNIQRIKLGEENIYASEEDFFNGNAIETESEQRFWTSNFAMDKEFFDFFEFDGEGNIEVYTDTDDIKISKYNIVHEKGTYSKIHALDDKEYDYNVRTYISRSDRDQYRAMDVVDENGTHTHVSLLDKLVLNDKQREAWETLRVAMEKMNEANMWLIYDPDNGRFITMPHSDNIEFNWDDDGINHNYLESLNGSITSKHATYFCECFGITIK